MADETKKAICAKCGAEFEQSKGRGRPRKFCANCRPTRAAQAPVTTPVAV